MLYIYYIKCHTVSFTRAQEILNFKQKDNILINGFANVLKSLLLYFVVSDLSLSVQCQREQRFLTVSVNGHTFSNLAVNK